jgi:hypothetical protein
VEQERTARTLKDRKGNINHGYSRSNTKMNFEHDWWQKSKSTKWRITF